MMRWAQQGWERLSLYLPVLLMGLLALGTWWLVRNAPAPIAAAAGPSNPHQPDYFMKLFSVKSFDATGRMQSEIKGEMGRHYPDTDTLEVDKVHMRSVTPQGLVTLATADRALSNADGSEVQLFGNAVVTRHGGVVRCMARFHMGIGGGAGQGAAAHDGQIGPVVTHGSRLRPRKPQARQHLLGRGALVFGAEHGMLDTQRLQAQAQRGRIAASDDGRGDAGLLQQLQAMPVQGVEALERFAGFAEIQAAIGQHPVHIEKGHAHALGLQQQHGIEAERRAAVGC